MLDATAADFICDNGHTEATCVPTKCRGCKRHYANAYYAANREYLRTRDRERYAANAELRKRVSEKRKQYRRENRERLNAVARQRYADSPDKRREYRKQRALSGASREYQLKYAYGITPEQYDRMSEAQGGTCAICKSEAKLYVDHCHSSGKVRGLLCDKCNKGIGMMKDSPSTLRRAAEYLENTK